VIPELDLVEEQDKITHQVQLDDDLECQEGLNFFKFDPEFGEKERQWDLIKKEIVGDYFD
jgi:pre-mRNA-splicing factor CWC22